MISVADQVSNANYQDPGWRPRVLLRRGDGLTTLRVVFLSLVAAPLLILRVLTFLDKDVGSPSAPLLVGVVTLSTAAAYAARRLSRGRLDPHSPEKSATSYRTRFFLAFAINEAPVLIAFALTFVEDALWPYLVALPIFLVGMLGIAPGRRNLESLERDLMQRGATFSLRAELAKGPSGLWPGDDR